MTEAEIAGYMGWRGPGAYTQHQMKKIKAIVAEAQRREREADAQWLQNAGTIDGRRAAEAIRSRGQA